MNYGNVDGAVSPPQTEGEIISENSSNSPQKTSPAGDKSPPSPKLKPWKRNRMVVDGAVSQPQTEGEIIQENSPQKISPTGEKSPPSPKVKPVKRSRMSSSSKNEHPQPTVANEKFREYRLKYGWKKTACKRENGNTAGKNYIL